MGKFEIRRREDTCDYYWILTAHNGKVIARSAGDYQTRVLCENGISSVLRVAPGAEVVDLTESYRSIMANKGLDDTMYFIEKMSSLGYKRSGVEYKKGDVVIWCSEGSRGLSLNRSRTNSLYSHYYFDQDTLDNAILATTSDVLNYLEDRLIDKGWRYVGGNELSFADKAVSLSLSYDSVFASAWKRGEVINNIAIGTRLYSTQDVDQFIHNVLTKE